MIRNRKTELYLPSVYTLVAFQRAFDFHKLAQEVLVVAHQEGHEPNFHPKYLLLIPSHYFPIIA